MVVVAIVVGIMAGSKGRDDAAIALKLTFFYVNGRLTITARLFRAVRLSFPAYSRAKCANGAAITPRRSQIYLIRIL